MTAPGSSAGSVRPPSLTREGPPTLDELQEPVRERLDRVMDEIRRIVFSEFDRIEEVNQYLLLMRGKLFRPTLVLLANEVGGTPGPRAETLAALVELVHLATLVHDDSVDHSVLRRGLPTVNALWTHQVAVIMGDFLYSRSLLELARLGDVAAIHALARASNEMSVGEMRQLTSRDALDFSEDAYDRLNAAKTASLMAAACEVGALAAGGRHREPLARFGHNLGMAFQVIDDLLDYTGSEEETGKPVSHDLRERKVTLPLVAALQRASAAERREIEEFFTLVRPSDEDIRRMVERVTALGGIEHTRARALDFGARAEEALVGLPEGAALDALRDSVSYVIDRSR